MVRPRCSGTAGSRKSCSRGHWRPAEDETLRQLVRQYGPQNWNFIAEHLEGRSGKSCRLRWYNQLDPNIIKKPFTDEEEERLLGLHKVKGNKWAAIARFFPGRTDNAVKNHFHVLMARRQRERFTLSADRGYHNQYHTGDSSTNIPNSAINFNPQNLRSIGIFGMSSPQSSTITSELVSFDAFGVKAHKESSDSSASGAGVSSYGLDHFGAYSTPAGSCMLRSYHSFTAPGIPSIGKVVPLPYNFSNSNYGRGTEDLLSKSKTGKHQDDNSVALCKLALDTQQQGDESLELAMDTQQQEDEPLKQKGLSFIDFLGVGSSSGNYSGPF